jgi:Mrp family chromosome partitioning ATPase
LELSFIVIAIRRHLWVVALCAILGLIPGLIAHQGTSDLFEAHSVLLVTPPTQNRGATISLSDPDRYVIGQLSVLQSSVLAERVATAMGGSETRRSIDEAVEIVHRAKTDVVDVYARTSSPTRSLDIADRYVTMYMADLTTNAKEAQAGDIDALKAELTVLEDEILFLDNDIQSKMQPFIDAAQEVRGQGISSPPIPDVNVVVPRSITLKTTKLNQYNQVLDNLRELELIAKLKVTTEIVQAPILPTIATASSSRLVAIAGMVGGGLFGVIAAIVMARLSKRVISTDQLAVRAEAAASVGQSLTVAVVGTERGAAATTLALALAGRYANSGSQVVVVDADQRDPEVSRLFGAAKNSGVPGLLALMNARQLRARDDRRLETALPSPFTETSVPEIRILGGGDKTDGNALRRTNIPDVLKATTAEAHIVLIDAGPILESAVAVQFCQLVDAVVLAVPRRRQRTAALEVVARQLVGRRGAVLPVMTSPSRRRNRSNSSAAVAMSGEPSIARPSFDDRPVMGVDGRIPDAGATTRAQNPSAPAGSLPSQRLRDLLHDGRPDAFPDDRTIDER